MVIDFDILGSKNTADTVLHPREIFNALPKKNAKFQYPRDVQSQVWNQWFLEREKKDIIIKMNTGSGKTIVGLLILKSSLNEKKGPAVYIAPDNYLIQQILAEANDLGIEVTTNADSPRFLSGNAVLVINIHKLVNGLSVFGVGSEGVKIDIGTLLIDDAHACLDYMEDQFTITIDLSCPAYNEIYKIFKRSLQMQCESREIEIETNDPNAYMLVPFWDWQDKYTEVLKILIKNKEESCIKFSWPLLKESFQLSRCVISGNKIEISPHYIPIHIIPSITLAARRIFMTATLLDDSILTSHFGVTEESLSGAIVPETAGDIGDRMILVPQNINTEFSNENIKSLCQYVARSHNVIVIVPSDYRVYFWSDVANLVLKKDNIHEGISKLKSQHVGLVVLVNRYDGIDLPKNACRLLVIDGLPDVRRLIEKVRQGLLLGSDKISSQIIQKIEQGMGRGVRSSDDYCVVLLMGKNLSSQLYAKQAIEKFSPGTRAQFELSERLSSQIKGKSLQDLLDVIKLCLDQNEQWVKTSKGVMATLVYDTISSPNPVELQLRRAYDYALRRNYREAAKIINDQVNSTEIKSLKGFLKQCLAEYINYYDSAEAQKVLLSGVADNIQILKPLHGIDYHKLASSGFDQAQSCVNFLTSTYTDPNKLIIDVNGLLETIIFKPETSNIFEESFKNIARYIGFTSQRPENEYKKGPDVLWGLGELKYLVIECKNGAISDKINKHDCNQLNGSVNWFESKYDISCQLIPILVHPSNVFEYAASPHKLTRIITEPVLEGFKKNIYDFISAICIQDKYKNPEEVKKYLTSFNLLGLNIFTGLGITFRTS